MLHLKVMNKIEKYCALTLDEMSIAQSVEFDIRSGRVMGDVTLPGHTGKATHGCCQASVLFGNRLSRTASLETQCMVRF